ncbi:unnamed protein product [Boreogadus saida]
MEVKRTFHTVLALMWMLLGDSHIVEFPRLEMEVVKGRMAVLQAWYSPTADIAKNSVVWLFMGNGSKQVINFSSGEVGYGENEFTGRVGFSAGMPSANLSIFINSTQESDSGRYLCSVIVPGRSGLSGQMHLNVKVPPSPPVCSLEGDPVLNGNVTLGCQSSQGKPDAPRQGGKKTNRFLAYQRRNKEVTIEEGKKYGRGKA